MKLGETLSAADVVALGRVLDLISAGARIRRLVDDEGTIQEGTLRHLCTADNLGAYPPGSSDVRSAFVRITTRSGWEASVALTELARQLQRGEFAEDPR